MEHSASRPRTIITADPELDDLNSMIRLVLYSNELKIEGLIYASSRFHWKGDGKGTTFFLPEREYDEPRESFRWAPGERFIDDVLDAYANVHPNLVVHDPRYPTAAELRGVVREGNVDFEGDMSADTPGSRLIEQALLDDQPGPIHLQVWAGTSTIARALRSIEERFAGSADWQDLRSAISKKAIITKFASQDATYDDYIRPTWPDIRVTDVAGFAWGYLARRVLFQQDATMLGADWMRQHVTSVGPLGALYRVWGDGRQMVEGDYTDFFHLSGLSAKELESQGYRVWTEPRPAGEWISEGDTPNMLNLFDNGLRGYEHPSYGGWAGRATRMDEAPDSWSTKASVDRAPDGTSHEEYSVTRWFGDAQRDFVTRLKWSVTATYEEANHPPEVSVESGCDHLVVPGSPLRLSARAVDPDGDAVTYRWWFYGEAGTYPGEVVLSGASGPEIVVAVPDDAESGQTMHVMLEVTDSAPIPLKRYARVILTVA